MKHLIFNFQQTMFWKLMRRKTLAVNNFFLTFA